MQRRSWITGEIAFSGQVLDNLTEHCARHAEETNKLLVESMPPAVAASLTTSRADPFGPASTLSIQAFDSAAAGQQAKSLKSSVTSAVNGTSAVTGLLPLKPNSETSRAKRALQSPSKSPARKKLSLHQTFSGPGGAQGTKVTPKVDSAMAANFPLRPPQQSRPASPLRAMRATGANVNRPAQPSPSRAPAHKPLSELNTTHGAGPGAVQAKKAGLPPGVSRLMMPTAASAARVNTVNTESTDSPLARKNTHKRVVSNASASSVKHKPAAKPVDKPVESVEPQPAEGRASRVLRSASRFLGLSKDEAGAAMGPTGATAGATTNERSPPKKPFAPSYIPKVPANTEHGNPEKQAPASAAATMKPTHLQQMPPPVAASAAAVSTPIPARAVVQKPGAAGPLKGQSGMPPPKHFQNLNMAAPPKPLDGLTYSKEKIEIVGMPPPAVAQTASPAPAALPDLSDFDESSVLLPWAYTPEVAKQLESQGSIDPTSVFGPIPPLKMASIFNTRQLRPRTSSGVWVRDGLSAQEKADYNERMGFTAKK